MSMTFTKLFNSITESTVWFEPDSTRLVWITMLAMSDRQGRVFASVPGLAGRARVDIEATRKALQCFLSPDPDSRTKDFEGRRLEEIDGGWRLLNHAKYRELRDEEARRQYQREWVRERRQSRPKVSTVDQSRPPSTYAEAEADAYTDKNQEREARASRSARATRLPDDFELTPERRAIAVAEMADPEREFAQFTDHFRAAPGAKGRKNDWDATWRNWCRRAPDFKPRKRSDDYVPERTWRPDPKDDLP